jgi:SAM-dependent methyltransferase
MNTSSIEDYGEQAEYRHRYEHRDEGEEYPQIHQVDRHTAYQQLGRAQQEHWQRSYRANPRLHSSEPSEPVRWTADRFTHAGIDDVLELGAGHGRDALYLAARGFSVHATDFSDAALDQLRVDAQRNGLDDKITATLHDVRDPLPPAPATVGAVYANLLLSMALTTAELRTLVGEVHRVLRPGGLFVYTALHVGDPERGHGSDRGDGLYDFDDLTLRFFDRGLIEHLGHGWTSDQVFELNDVPPHQPMWLVSQSKPF